MPLLSTRGNASARAFGLTSGAGGEELGGMVLMTPTSITSTGTGNSSSINQNGSVSFSSCVTLSLNGIFTSEYTNYSIVTRHTSGLDGQDFTLRLRTTGTDASGTHYAIQYLDIDTTSVNPYRNTSQTSWAAGFSGTQKNGCVINIYGPQISGETAYRSFGIGQYSGAEAAWREQAGTHSQNISYDGLTFIAPSGYSISGQVCVYGLVGA